MKSGKGACLPAKINVDAATEAVIMSDDIRAQASDSNTTGNCEAVRINMKMKVNTDNNIIGSGFCDMS